MSMYFCLLRMDRSIASPMSPATATPASDELVPPVHEPPKLEDVTPSTGAVKSGIEPAVVLSFTPYTLKESTPKSTIRKPSA